MELEGGELQDDQIGYPVLLAPVPVIKSEEDEDSDSDNFLKLESQPCLICLTWDTSRGGGGGAEVEWWKQFWRDDDDEEEGSTLSRNIAWIFLLRNLLQVPKEQVASLLSKTGVDPGEWRCSLCGRCSQLAVEAFHLHQECGRLMSKIENIGRQLRTEIREGTNNFGRMEEEEEDFFGNDDEPGGTLPVHRIIREFIGGGVVVMPKITAAGYAGDAAESCAGNIAYLNDASDRNDDDDDDRGEDEEEESDPLYIPQKHIAPDNPRSMRRSHKASGSTRHKQKSTKANKTRFVCPICSHSAPSHLTRMRHMQLRHPKATLTCGNCDDFETNSASTYYKHENEHKIRDALEPAPKNGEGEGSEDLLRCKFCCDTDTSGPWLKMYRHMKLKHLPQLGIASFSCSTCEFVGFRKGELAQHCLRIHGTTTTSPGGVPPVARAKQWKCDLCPSAFYTRSHLKGHLKAVHHSAADPRNPRDLLECKVCGTKVFTRKLLISHMRVEHQELYTFKCDSCGIGCRSKELLRTHVNSKHGEPAVCPHCGKTLRNQIYLKRHLKTWCRAAPPQALPPVACHRQCDICGKEFNSALSFSLHSRHHHHDEKEKLLKRGGTTAPPKSSTNDEKFVCEQCGSTFSRRSDMKTHSLKFHPLPPGNDDDEDQALISVVPNNPAAHEGHHGVKCKWCGVSLLHHKMLALHMRVEHGELFKYKCDLCDAQYQTSYDLNLHKGSKHLKRTWICEYCNGEYSFSTRRSSHWKRYCKSHPTWKKGDKTTTTT